jgi:hypothetical protein
LRRLEAGKLEARPAVVVVVETRENQPDKHAAVHLLLLLCAQVWRRAFVVSDFFLIHQDMGQIIDAPTCEG